MAEEIGTVTETGGAGGHGKAAETGGAGGHGKAAETGGADGHGKAAETGSAGGQRDVTDPAVRYINRELSWLRFNERVLLQACREETPLFERLKFLAITSGNLDEFFMIRVASLKDMIGAGYQRPDISGMLPEEQLLAVTRQVHAQVKREYEILTNMLIPDLRDAGLLFVPSPEFLSRAETDYIDRYFDDTLYPVLTPMAVDSSRPFPLIRSLSLNIGALVRRKGTSEKADFAMVQVPAMLHRLVEIPQEGTGTRKAILIEQIILRNMKKLFLNYDIVCASTFRIGRNADLLIDEVETEDLLEEIEKQLKKRKWGQVLRLETEMHTDRRLLERISGELGVTEEETYLIDGPLDLTFLEQLAGIDGFDRYRERSYGPPQPHPRLFPDTDIFTEIRRGDLLLHHPYESFAPVVRFVEEAAGDPDVLAIKQTLYRVSGNSPIIAALVRAAENGKQVSVLVELKARFDEENNIVWARRLEQAGCHVIYGLAGLKTHCKITLVVRREDEGIRRYVHLGTGNYNDATARLYTDLGMLTCREDYGADATAVFNMLSGYSEPPVWNRLLLAPLWLKERLLYLIRRETEHALMGEEAHIIAKMNALCHKEIIDALYEASGAGVKIDLIVRGICSLRAGVPGLSDNITVRSVVGHYLEHSRICYFANGDAPEYYLSSADWMVRNLERRVEIMFRVEDKTLCEALSHILEVLSRDTVQAQILQPDGTYTPAAGTGKEEINAQRIFGEEARTGSRAKTTEADRTFLPKTTAGSPPGRHTDGTRAGNGKY